MKKRILAILLTVAMCLSLLPMSAFAAGTNPFTDVDTNDWFYDEVIYVKDNGLMNGTSDTTFSPGGNTTRGMIVTILHRLSGSPAADDSAFLDVDDSQYYAEAVDWAAANGVVTGYNANTFGPNDFITREQMAAILYRYAVLMGYDVSVGADTNILSYTDALSVSEYAVEAMQWAVGAGIINGVEGNRLNPQGHATRAQVAAILYRFCTQVVDETPVTYTVTFKLNYDGLTYKTITVEEGKTVTLPKAPTRSGYTFAGWYTAANGGVQFDASKPISGDVTLYAHWNKKSSSSSHSHRYGDWEANGDCTHSKKCSCGAAITNDCDEYSICSVCGFDRLAYVLEHGGEVTMKEDISADEYVASGTAEVTIKLDGKKLDGPVTNNGDLTINGAGTMESSAAGLVDKGTATLKDVSMKAGSPADYAVISRGGNTTLENVNIDSAGGGVGAADGAKIVFDGGSVAVNSESTSGRYVFYAAGEGTEITIKDGNFSFSKTLNQKRAYIYAGEGSTVYVKGGNFGPASKRDGYTAGIMGDGTVIITGGTFGFDPTKWVAEGYYASKEGDVWTVKPCEGHAFTAEAGYHKCDNCSFTEMCTPEVVDGDAVTCAVCGNDYVVAAEATFDLENVAIQNDGAGLESYGSVTLKDVDMKAGSPADYAVIIRGGTANIENLSLDSAGGGVGVVGGAKAVFDGGSVAVNTTSTSGRYNFYVVDEGTELTIKDGDFSFSKTLNQKRAYIYAGEGSTVYVEGGNFGPASKRDGYTAGIMGDGTVIITGGTFGFDPTKWVAEGYCATKEGDVWKVAPETESELRVPMFSTGPSSQTTVEIVNDPEIPDVAKIGERGFDTLADALKAAADGDTVTLIENINLDWNDRVLTATSSYPVLAAVEDTKSITLDMNGKTISVDHQSTADRIYAVIYVADGASLRVIGDGKIDVDVHSTKPKVAYMFWKRGENGSLTIENGYYHMDHSEDSVVYANDSDTTIVNGGTFILDTAGTGSSNGFPWIFSASGNGVQSILVNGGSYNIDITKQYWAEARLGEGLIVQQKSDGMYHVIRPVLSITNQSGETVYFDTMTEAIAAAQNGDTIVLEQDVSVGKDIATDLGIAELNYDRPNDNHVTFFCVEGKNITIDLNGNNVYGDCAGLSENTTLAGIFSTRNNGQLTLKDSSDDGTGKVEVASNGANVYAMIINLDLNENSSKIIIESGTYILDRSVSAMIDTRCNEGVIVNGGTFDLGNVNDPGLKNGQAWTFNAKGQNTRHVIVTGGTFPADIQHQYYPFEVSMAKELALQYDEGTGMYTVVPAVAYVNEQEFSGRWYTNEVGYATMEEAYAAVEPPKTSWDGQVSEQEYVTSLIADYYGSLADAFGETNALEGSAGASVSVAEEGGKKVVTLLDDVALTETLNIVEDATLVLNGHEITNGDNVYISPAIRTNADVVIDGTAEGSAITVNAPVVNKGTVLSAKVGTLTVNGGTYTSNTSGAGTSESYNYAVYTYAGTELNVNNATILAKDTGAKGFTVGIHAVGNAVLNNTTVIAEANYLGNDAGNNYGSASRGIYSTASLELYDCYIWGAHSGVTTTGSVYVDDGTYEGFGHGGFYLAGGSKTSYFYNATINWAPMRDGFEYDNVAGTNAAGMYISGASNITAYFDNCKFNMNEANGETWGKWTCPYYAVVINKSNNEVYISNSYIEYAREEAFRINNSANNRLVYYGTGNTHSDTNVKRLITSGNDSQLIETNTSYANS